jgi:polyribonucleotide nucleotidyltransferase
MDDDLQMYMESITRDSSLHEDEDLDLIEELNYSLRLMKQNESSRRQRLDECESTEENQERQNQRNKFFNQIQEETTQRLEQAPRPSVDQVLKYFQKRYPQRIGEQDLRSLRRFIRELQQTIALNSNNFDNNHPEFVSASGVKSKGTEETSAVFILEPTLAVPACDIPNCLCRK